MKDLRTAVEGLDLVDLAGDEARVRIGAVEVTVRLGAHDMTAWARSPGARPLFVQAGLDPLGGIAIETSDRAFADALLDDGTRDRLARSLFGKGRAVLASGRWTLSRVDHDLPVRDLAQVTAWLAARPDAITTRWRALADRLGATWRGAWDTLGGARIALDDGMVLDAIAMAPGSSDPPRLRTVVHRSDGDAPTRWPEPWRALVVFGREGACLHARGLDAAWLWGLCSDADAIAELTAQVGTRARPRAATAAAAAPAIAPISVIDWPASRAPIATAAARSDAIPWTLVPMPGSDAVAGLDETVDVDGVAVRTEVLDGSPSWIDRDHPPARVRVTADARGAAPAMAARPGYRFLLGLFSRDVRIGDAAIDDRYLLRTDDLPWTRWWLGAVERRALLATFDAEALAPFALVTAPGAIRFECGGLPPRRILDAARQATAFLAGRGRRAAADWRGLAPALGATVRGEAWTTGGEFALLCERGAARVTIDFATALPRDRGGPRLRTCVRAPRLADERMRLAVHRDDLPRRRRARVRDLDEWLADGELAGRSDDAAWARARLAGCATPLERAAPDALAIERDQVILSWEGPLDDAIRLQAAIDAVAYLSVELGGGDAGPYR